MNQVLTMFLLILHHLVIQVSSSVIPARSFSPPTPQPSSSPQLRPANWNNTQVIPRTQSFNPNQMPEFRVPIGFQAQTIMSPIQPHLKLSPSAMQLPWFQPKPQKRALNLVRFVEQYKRGLPDAMALYNAILESHEKRWMLNENEFQPQELMRRHPSLANHPGLMVMQDRKVGKIVSKITRSFIADCVGVIISEMFRKVGEIAGELARLVVSEVGQHVLGGRTSNDKLGQSISILQRIAESKKKS